MTTAAAQWRGGDGVVIGSPEHRARWEQAQIDCEVRHSEALLATHARTVDLLEELDRLEGQDAREWLREEATRMLAAGWSLDELAEIGLGPEILHGLRPVRLEEELMGAAPVVPRVRLGGIRGRPAHHAPPVPAHP